MSSPTPEPVIDASPLIVLGRAGRLELLRLLADRLLVPAAVAEEVRAHSDEAERLLRRTAWLRELPPATVPEPIRKWDLGPGESSVLSWAFEHPTTLAVVDDYAARRCAAILEIPVKGTLGLALLAKVRGSVPNAAPVVEDLRRAGLYLSAGLVRRALSLVGE